MITINQNKAIEITKDAIRANRSSKLEALDVEFQRALETGANTDDIVAQKQVLRDATTAADGKTVEELKTIIEGLN
jgi:hypothetical protein